MGIQGLLPLLKSIEKPVHLKDCSGQTLAVDGYVWLHKGAFACAQELCLGQPTQKYITYFMRRIELFKHFGIKPYVVFDGGYLPSKAATEQDRLSRREESKKLAMDLHKAYKSKEALEQFRKCVDVTPEMAFAVIQALKTAQVDFVVAPYEADAQLAYLEKTGLVDGIVTEDSDLLVFGCKRVIFKLDQYGAGVEILQENFGRVRDVSFQDWTMTEFRHMCILSGCDYLPSIPGMGLKTAQRYVRRFKSFERTIKYIRMESMGSKIQADYEDSFRKADLTFLYARVYDPTSKSMVHLNSVPEELEELVQTEEYDFLGPVLKEDVLHGVVTGKLDPIHKTPLTCPSVRQPVHKVTVRHMDKENNLNVGKSRHPAQPSSRSLYTYFSKPTATFTKPAVQAVDHVETKREPLKDASTLPTKREPLKDPNTLPTKRAPPPAKLTPFFDNPATKDPPPPAPQKQSSPHNSFTVVVETKSRFFGHEATVSSGSEALEDSRKRSCPSREDSGIGLDETYLLHGSEADGCLSGQEEFSAELSASKTEESRPKSKYRVVSMTREPSHPHSSALTSPAEDDFTFELKKAEAKVIQGWREKFSNPSGAGAGAGRTPGLTRANQASLYLSKSTPSLPPTFRLKQQQERSTNGPRQGGGVGVVRMAAGHPPYHLGMTRPLTGVSSAIAGKGVYRSSPSMDRMSASQDDGSELQGAPVHHDGLDALNLDRFKYTP